MNIEDNHIAIDIEALGQKETSIITAISCVSFNFKQTDRSYEDILNDTFYAKISIADQKRKYNRTFDKETMEWWKEQPEEAKVFSLYPSDEDITLDDAIDRLKNYIQSRSYNYGESYLWTRGIDYDVPKLKSAFADVDAGKFINFWKCRDSKTYFDVLYDTQTATYDLPDGNPSSFVKHHAKFDVALDVYKMLHLLHNG